MRVRVEFMIYPPRDKVILRELGVKIAKIASLPINEQRREMHKKTNNLEKTKPTIHIYEVPWHEMDVNNELKLATQNPFCQRIETDMKRTLYMWRHMQADMVVESTVVQPLIINDTGFGITEDVTVAKTDERSDIVSRHFHIQIKNEEDIEKIKMPVVTFDREKTEEEYQARCEIFDKVLNVEKRGMPLEKKIYPWKSTETETSFWFTPWDDIVRWTGVQEILVDMFRRPKYVHCIIERTVDAWLSRLEQYKRLGVLKADPMEFWGIGAAQIFSACSPAMHEEFALKHETRWFSKFGRNFYGCCEPLDEKVDIVKKNIPRLRKISMSAWVNFDRAVEKVGDEIVFAWKPSPAVLAAPIWDPEGIQMDLEEKMEKARNCVVEIHMKDISTVRYQPQRLWDWSRIASKVTQKYPV